MTIVHHNMTRAQVEELVANAGSKFIRVEEWCGEIVYHEPRWIELLRETAIPDPVDPKGKLMVQYQTEKVRQNGIQGSYQDSQSGERNRRNGQW